MEGQDLAKDVTCSKPYQWDEGLWQAPGSKIPVPPVRHRVVAYDFGIKRGILRRLRQNACAITVVPAATGARDVLDMKPDGIFLSNGPGDPAAVSYAVEAAAELCGSGKPIFGICLGHQILGLALGGKTYKLKFGHHGGNHPILNHRTGKVEITAQNHNFNVDPESLPADVERTHTNLNDQTLAGLRHKTDPMFSVQYHPEASPGPHDSHYLFRDFRKMMEDWKK
jgi:carbamoyl-phosphate synthase small subunit